MKTIIYFIGLLFLFSITSCEKIVELDLDKNNDKLVIEGVITNNAGPYFVKVSKSVNLSDGNQVATVSDALVTITDNNGNLDTLTSISNGLYQTNSTVGVIGRNYILNVEHNGKNYSAQSKMPNLVNFDSIKVVSFKSNGEMQYNIIPIYLDPITVGNCYFFKLKINNIPLTTYYPFNDNLNNGLYNQRPLRNRESKTTKRDNVEIEMNCIDLNTYTYFYALNRMQGGGLGSSAPSNPPSNINGDALGYFSAQTSQTLNTIIK